MVIVASPTHEATALPEQLLYALAGTGAGGRVVDERPLAGRIRHVEGHVLENELSRDRWVDRLAATPEKTRQPPPTDPLCPLVHIHHPKPMVDTITNNGATPTLARMGS